MTRNIKKSKGITLISMILTIIVLLIIIGAISYGSRNSLQKKKLDNFFNDIDALSDAVSVYYVKNGKLPVYYSNYDIRGDKCEFQEITIGSKDEADKPYISVDEGVGPFYYVLDISKLQDISLNNKHNIPDGIGDSNFFKNKDTDWTNLKKSIDDGIFVMNSVTHRVFYTKRIEVDGNRYYTKIEDISKLPTYSAADTNTAEDDIVKAGDKPEISENEMKIIFDANGGTNAADYIVISKDKSGTDEDKLLYKLNELKDSIKVPTRTGMSFVGWATKKNSDKDNLEYKYNKANSSPYEINGSVADIQFSGYAGKELYLYAVWEFNTSNILYCYYPNSTGGILPIISNNEVSRTTGGYEAINNYVCIDVPTSGYIIKWNWVDDSEYPQYAQYAGDSMTTLLTSEDKKVLKTEYETTEPGAIQLRGHFTNLRIYSIADGNEKVTIQYDTGGKKFAFYKAWIPKGDERKNRASDETQENAVHWLTGRDGKFTVPTNPQTYQSIGMQDPERSVKYVNEGSESADQNIQFYLKAAIYAEEKDRKTLVDYVANTKQLGEVVDFSSGEDYHFCLYPRFGARNYRLVGGGDKVYYHENLQEAYDQAYALQKSGQGYDNIVLVKNVYKTNLASTVTEDHYEDYYIQKYDPSYYKTVSFSSINTEHLGVTIDFKKHTMDRTGQIEVSKGINLTTTSTNSGSNLDYGFSYKGSANEAFKIQNSSNMYLTGGISLKSYNKAIVGLYDNSKLYAKKGTIENVNVTNAPGVCAINSTASNTNICLGLTENEATNIKKSHTINRSDVIIKTKWGLPIYTLGNIYWSEGILKTQDPANKQGYNDEAESKIITINNNKKPCLTYSATDDIVSIILEKRDWMLTDVDNGSMKAYYTYKLQEASNSLNLVNNTSKVYEIKWLNPIDDSHNMSNPDSGTTYNNDATINKVARVNFDCINSDSPKFNTSTITITGTRVYVTNLYTKTRKRFCKGWYF